MRILFVVLTLMVFPLSAFSAPPLAVTATIKTIRTGWDLDSFGIETNEPIQNPAGCPTADGYVADSSQPGYNTYYAAALTAFVERAKMQVIIDGTPNKCSQSRPKIIGVNLIR